MQIKNVFNSAIATTQFFLMAENVSKLQLNNVQLRQAPVNLHRIG